MTNDDQAIDKRRWKVPTIIFLCVVGVSVGGNYAYKELTGLPRRVRIATGVEGGRYRSLMEAMGAKLSAKGIRVELIATDGSLENIKKLEDGDVDLALFQTGAQELRGDTTNEKKVQLRTVANVYSEVVHILVRRDSNIKTSADFKGKRISIGNKSSGDNVSARIVLAHLGLTTADIDARAFDYDTMHAAFLDDSLDAAFVTVGLGAEKIQQIILSHNVDLMEMPFSNLLTIRNLSVHDAAIPAGMYQIEPTAIPDKDIQSVSMRAQLLTRDDVSLALVEEVTSILMAQDFQRDQQLRELFESGAQFARSKTMFPLHDGAGNHFDPELKPLLPPDFVEATENMRSFIVSVLIAGYLGFRWFKQHRTRSQEHKLDIHIRALLAIERRQMDLDEKIGLSDIDQLQRLLDAVTKLQQQALGTLSAHELTDDSAAPVFIQMCHALSEKINAKLSRQRIDLRLSELIDSNAQSSATAGELRESTQAEST